MRHAAKGQGGPARHALNHQASDRELLELERRKLVELNAGRISLTREGYRLLVQKFPRRSS